MIHNLYDDRQVDQIIRQKFDEKIGAQPWYRKSANTVTSIGTLLATILAVVISSGVEIPGNYLVWVAVAIQVLGVIGIRITPNGVTNNVRDAILTGKHREG